MERERNRYAARYCNKKNYDTYSKSLGRKFFFDARTSTYDVLSEGQLGLVRRIIDSLLVEMI